MQVARNISRNNIKQIKHVRFVHTDNSFFIRHEAALIVEWLADTVMLLNKQKPMMVMKFFKLLKSRVRRISKE